MILLSVRRSPLVVQWVRLEGSAHILMTFMPRNRVESCLSNGWEDPEGFEKNEMTGNGFRASAFARDNASRLVLSGALMARRISWQKCSNDGRAKA
jgi:hypothetical protein